MCEKSRAGHGNFLASNQPGLDTGGLGIIASSRHDPGARGRGRHEVHCGDLVYNKSLNCDYVKLDLLDINNTTKELFNFDIIINCVGQITYPFNLCLQLNSIGTSNLAKALSGKSARLIHISTVAVYGSSENCNEESPLNPETNYATAKAFAEQILLRNNNKERITILRLSNLYGSNQMKGVFAYLLRSYHSDRNLRFNNNDMI